MTTSEQTPVKRPLPNFEALRAQLEIEGWKDGPPASVHLRSQRIDQATCKRLYCPGCKVRGLAYHPLHRGERYRVLAECRQCGIAAEV